MSSAINWLDWRVGEKFNYGWVTATTVNVDYREYVVDLHEIDTATKKVLETLRRSCACIRSSARIELGQLLWEQAMRHFLDEGGANPVPVRLEGTRNRSSEETSAWPRVLPDLFDRIIKGTGMGVCHRTIYDTTEALREVHQARAVNSHVTVGVDLIPSNPFPWEGNWGTQILFHWFIIEREREGANVSKTYIVESRLIVTKIGPLDPAEKALLEGSREEDSGATDDVGSRAPTGLSGSTRDLSSANTVVPPSETISGKECTPTLPGDGSTLAAPPDGDGASYIKRQMSLNEILQ